MEYDSTADERRNQQHVFAPLWKLVYVDGRLVSGLLDDADHADITGSGSTPAIGIACFVFTNTSSYCPSR